MYQRILSCGLLLVGLLVICVVATGCASERSAVGATYGVAHWVFPRCVDVVSADCTKDVTLSGFVYVYNENKPVPQARVLMSGDDEEVQFTDSEGAFRFSVSSGEYQIEAQWIGHWSAATGRIVVQPGDSVAIKFMLDARGIELHSLED